MTTTIFNNGRTAVSYGKDIHQPIMVVNVIEPNFEGMEVPERAFTLTAQIWHTHLNEFPLRKAIPVDHDERRPIFQFHFSDLESLTSFLRKRTRYLIAYELIAYPINGHVHVLNWGNDLDVLRLFKAWIHFITRRVIKEMGQCVSWARDVVIEERGEGFMVGNPSITLEQFLDSVETDEPIPSKALFFGDEVVDKVDYLLNNMDDIAEAEKERNGVILN